MQTLSSFVTRAARSPHVRGNMARSTQDEDAKGLIFLCPQKEGSVKVTNVLIQFYLISSLFMQEDANIGLTDLLLS